MVSEITEEWDEDAGFIPGDDDETRKQRIRQIIRYQKSLFDPSVASSSSSHASSYSSLSDRNGKLMKGGGSSLRRLFDMERDAQLSLISPQLERGYSSRVEISDSPATSRRDVLSKVPKPKLLNRLQRTKWRRWRISGLGLRFRRFRIRICWPKHLPFYS